LLFETAFSFHEIVLTTITLYRSVCKEHSKSISSGAQYVALQECFSHPSLVLYFFPYPMMLPSEHEPMSRIEYFWNILMTGTESFLEYLYVMKE